MRTIFSFTTSRILFIISCRSFSLIYRDLNPFSYSLLVILSLCSGEFYVPTLNRASLNYPTLTPRLSRSWTHSHTRLLQERIILHDKMRVWIKWNNRYMKSWLICLALHQGTLNLLLSPFQALISPFYQFLTRALRQVCP
jgi:hypothetical protein